MHKLTKLSERSRRDVYERYLSWYKVQAIAYYYHVHRNLVRRIIKRWKIWDFKVHSSCRLWYKSLQYWLKKIDVIVEKIKKKQDKYGSIIRYEKEYAGELTHIDLHKLKNIKGQDPKKKQYHAWVIDDATRVCYSEILPNKKAQTVALFFKRSVQWFKDRWVIIKAVLCDNWKEFTTHRAQWKENHIFTKTCRELWIKQKFTRVRRPQTNWKIERRRRTSQTEWFTKVQFNNWKQAETSLQSYMYRYNYYRKHWSLWAPPMTILEQKLLKSK
jgi:hypothetical protein